MLDVVTDLVVAAALLHLAGHLEHLLDAGRADGVSEGEKSAARVDRDVAANRRATLAGQRTALPAATQGNHVEAARLSGASDMRILASHLFPNILPPMMVQISLNMGWAILNAAGLSFIGLGVQAPTPEWGIMVAEGATYIISGEWWVALFPGAVLMLAVFCFNLLGDGLRDIIDPRRRT